MRREPLSPSQGRLAGRLIHEAGKCADVDIDRLVFRPTGRVRRIVGLSSPSQERINKAFRRPHNT